MNPSFLVEAVVHVDGDRVGELRLELAVPGQVVVLAALGLAAAAAAAAAHEAAVAATGRHGGRGRQALGHRCAPLHDACREASTGCCTGRSGCRDETIQITYRPNDGIYDGPCDVPCDGPCDGSCDGPDDGPCDGPCDVPCDVPYDGPCDGPYGLLVGLRWAP